MATPRISFRPNHPFNKDKSLKTTPCPILVEVYSKNLRTELSTGLKVYPANFIDGRATSKEKDFRTINTELARIETAIMDVLETAKPADELKAMIRSAVRGEAPASEQKKTVENWIEQFIKESTRKDSTKQVYRSSFDHLKAFAEKKGIALTWEVFDMNFYDAFKDFLYTCPTIESDNTVGKIIKTLKTFLSESFERDLHQNLNFKKKGFKVISAEVDEIYLNETEIDQFDKVHVEPELTPAQKLFVFACDVGLRYGDYARLGPNNLTQTLDGPRLDLTTQKTGEDVKIPLTDRAKMIWDTWQGLPPRIPNQVFNEQIKLIAEKAKINKPTQRRTTIKGIVNTKWLPKFKMVTAHTARRSFATNSVLKKVPTSTIMAITGHRTEKAFKKYVKVDKEQHAAIMSQHLKEQSSHLMKKHAV